MSNLEHLIENGLSALKRGVSYEKWLKTMKNDVNWQGNENISIEQLWTICQYVTYTWIPSVEPEHKKGKWMWKTENRYVCSECGHHTQVDELFEEPMYAFCPYCSTLMLDEDGNVRYER